MQVNDSITFTRLADGTILVRQKDGSFRPMESKNEASLERLSDAEIEHMAASDPDHPALDDAFWTGVDLQLASKEAISIKLDQDILAFFRREGRGYQTRINAVLRHYVDARLKAG